MPLSSVPGDGPSIPDGATKVSIKNLDVTTASMSGNKEDVTDLNSTIREYADPVLVEPEDGGGKSATATCSASGFLKGSPPAVTPSNVVTGWVCEDAEVVYEVGKYATWSANWSYYAPSGS